MADRVFNIKRVNQGLRFIARLSLPLFWVAAILWLSLTPSPPRLPGALGWDKLLHAGAYSLLAVLLAQFLQHVLRSSRQVFWITLLLCTLFGAIVEVLQWAGQAGRTAEWWDLAADALGAFAGCVVFRQVVARFYCHEKD